MTNLVEYVKTYALDHYEDGGWDVVVECFSDRDITQVLIDACAHTENQALSAFAFMVDVWADRQAEARYQGEF